MEKFYRTGIIPREWKDNIKGGTNNKNYWSGSNPLNLFSDPNFNSPQFQPGGRQGHAKIEAYPGESTGEPSGTNTFSDPGTQGTTAEKEEVISGVVYEDENVTQDEVTATQTKPSALPPPKSSTTDASESTSKSSGSGRTTKFIDTKPLRGKIS